MRETTHYSVNQNPAKLADAANDAAKQIYKKYRADKLVPVLVYTGMSGIGLATAISLVLAKRYPSVPFHMMYVRKEGENAHGQAVEHTFGYSFGYVIDRSGDKYYGLFVDDCIDSGTTITRCRLAISGLMESNFVTNRFGVTSWFLTRGTEQVDSKSNQLYNIPLDKQW